MINAPELRGWSVADFAEEPNTAVPQLDGTVLKLPSGFSVVLKDN